MVQSCAVGEIEANLWEGTRLPFTAWQWSASAMPDYINSVTFRLVPI